MEIQVAYNYPLYDTLLFKLMPIQWVFTPLYYVFQVQKLSFYYINTTLV